MPVRPRFDPKRALIAARDFTFLGRAYAPGDPFPHADDAEAANDRLRARQYEARAVNFGPEEAAEEDPITMTGPKGGRYEINAPWLERPLTIRGKVNAEKALADLREEGAPLGWIDGGSDVEVEEVGGGWYAISAPWLDEPEKVQGREDAEARQREIHAEGEPATHHGVTLAESEGGNGYYDLTADWLDEPEKVHGIDAARERAAELREAGPPEGWTPEGGQEDAGGATSGDSAQSDTDAAAPASEGAQENAAKAETTEGADGADDADQASDTASDGDDADKAAGGDQAEAPAEGEAGKSEDPPADA